MPKNNPPAALPAAPTESPALDQVSAPGAKALAAFRRALRAGGAALKQQFEAGQSVDALVRERARLMDELIQHAWRLHMGPAGETLALIAVGGYGRGELHPCSDIDCLILTPDALPASSREGIETFLIFLWDIGLEVGHSTRTLADCEQAARDDITVATNLMEARLLAGNGELFRAMALLCGPAQLWPSRDFFAAKWREQTERHAKYHNTAYKLEPNVKEGPGGLRDIQMIGWVAKRHFGARTLHDLVSHGFLTEEEHAALTESQSFLWQVRYALHLLAGRREDRLLFDHQLKLAKQFGYRNAGHSLAVEQFMQRYYRTIMELSRLNEMLLALFEEAILLEPGSEATPINARFQERNGFLETAGPDVFAKHPSALLELFHVLQQHPELKGVSAATIRQVRKYRGLINEDFRADPRNRKLFMDILREPQGVTHELRRMNRYGILGRYIIMFGDIVGRMQYDLFHAYTVDEHILFVVSNLRRFALPRFNHEFPLCSEIMQALPKPELAYLAGLFHDIAKGRGGDHSKLGAQDAEEFCLAHDLSRYDARLVAWLVQHHLLLSITAQKKDITDPRAIHDFAVAVGDQLHLDYLYVLTVADVRGTNPELWNSWKASLFRELYESTKRALRRGLENPLDKDELIIETQKSALSLLLDSGADEAAVRELWHKLSEEYFLRHTPDEITWHTLALLEDQGDSTLLVQVRQQTLRGGTAVFIYTLQDETVFGRATAVLDQLGLTILDARVVATGGGNSLHTYLVHEDTGAAIDDPLRVEQIQRVLARELGKPNAGPMPVTRRAPRQVRMFSTPTQVAFTEDARNRRTVLEIVSGDRPGLLSEIGQAFQACGIRLQNAKITTVGERAEDVFFITDRYNRPLEAPRQAQLETVLREHLETAR